MTGGAADGPSSRGVGAFGMRRGDDIPDDGASRFLFDHAMDGMLLASPDGRILSANPAACRMFGRTEHDLRALGRNGVLDQGDPRMPAAPAERPAAGRLRSEVTLRRADGTSFPAEIISAGLAAPDGGPCTAMIIRDLTERVQVEEELRQREGIYRTLVEQLPAITAVWDAAPPHRYVFISPQVQTLLGFPPQAWIDDPLLWDRQVHADDRDRVDADFAAGLASGSGFRLDYRILTADGRVVWLQETCEPLAGIHGDGPHRYQSVATDATAHRTREQTLRDGEPWFRALIENSWDLFQIVDADRAIRYASPSTTRMTGEAPGDMLGRKIDLRLIHPDDQPAAARALAELEGRPGGRVEVELRVRGRDGAWRQMLVVGTNMLDDPSIAGVVLNWKDVTERRQMEDRLRATQEGYRTLVERVPAIVYSARFGPEGAWDFVSPQIEPILGFTAQEWTDDPALFDRLLHPEDMGDYHAREAVALTTGSLSARYRMTARDGRVVWIQDEARVFFDDFGAPTSMQGLMFDVTELRRAQERLAASEQRFRALIGNIADVVVLVDADGRYVYVSPSIRRIQGHDPDDLIGTNMFDFARMHPDDRDRVRPLFAEVLANSGRHVHAELRVRHADGRWIWVEASAGNLLDDPAVGGIVVNYRDVTARRQTERSRAALLARVVTAQEDERREIAADIHDDPLQKISAALLRLDLARRSHPDLRVSNDIAKLEESLRDAIGSLRHLMFRIRPPALDSDGLGRAIRAYLEEQASQEGAPAFTVEDRLVTNPPAELRTILYRLAQEALLNVRKHANASHVDVRLEEHKGGVVLGIQDDGVGFPIDGVPRSAPGHLGLTAMRERVEMAGGWMRVESEAGKGTSVAFWVPSRLDAQPA